MKFLKFFAPLFLTASSGVFAADEKVYQDTLKMMKDPEFLKNSIAKARDMMKEPSNVEDVHRRIKSVLGNDAKDALAGFDPKNMPLSDIMDVMRDQDVMDEVMKLTSDSDLMGSITGMMKDDNFRDFVTDMMSKVVSDPETLESMMGLNELYKNKKDEV